jgi:hypothetical protein
MCGLQTLDINVTWSSKLQICFHATLRPVEVLGFKETLNAGFDSS